MEEEEEALLASCLLLPLLSFPSPKEEEAEMLMKKEEEEGLVIKPPCSGALIGAVYCKGRRGEPPHFLFFFLERKGVLKSAIVFLNIFPFFSILLRENSFRAYERISPPSVAVATTTTTLG